MERNHGTCGLWPRALAALHTYTHRRAFCRLPLERGRFGDAS